MHVCVLGAGIVGLATAYQLKAQGHEVTVIDRTTPGQGASGGNGAQLSYAYVQPLAEPGIWAQLPKLLFAPDSPLKLRPRLDPQQWAWGLQFLAACRQHVADATTAQLLTLAAHSRRHFEAMLAREQLEVDFATHGKLVLYPTPEGLAAAQRQLALQQRLGAPEQQVLSPREAVAIEPALHHYAPQFAGAVYTPSECAADCLKVCEGLAQRLQQAGTRLLTGTPVTGLQLRQRRVVAVDTPAGPVEADSFVLALGADSPRVARLAGVDLPVYPLKGYSITLPMDAASAAPRVSVTDVARKVVFARLGARLRVAGMAELVGHDLTIPPQRLASLQRSTQALFPELSGTTVECGWSGLRPATPTGRPIVGRLPRAPENLLVNTGHGALGFTLAFGTAALVADQLAA